MKVVVTAADLEMEMFRCGGKGGQNVQKRSTGVRFRHPPSGAVAECTAHRTQLQNKHEAFRKLAESPRFRAWAAAELRAREQGHASLERKVDELMSEKNLRVEAGVGCAPDETHCDKKE